MEEKDLQVEAYNENAKEEYIDEINELIFLEIYLDELWIYHPDNPEKIDVKKEYDKIKSQIEDLKTKIEEIKIP